MRGFFNLAALGAPLLFVAVGCSDPQPMTCSGANVVANEKNNYAFTSTIVLPPVKVAPLSNLTFDWSGLSRDFLGHPINPATDVVQAIMMIWALPRADFETALNADELYPADLVVSPPLVHPIAGATSARLHDFMVNGTAVTMEMFDAYFDVSLFPPATSTFVVALQSGTEIGRDILMLQAFELDAASTSTNVSITDTSTALTYRANLHDLTITGVPGGTPAMTIDWLPMKTNALGAEFKENYITNAVVGHYTQTPAELEAKFLDLDRIATATYTADVPAGSTLDFTTLRDENNAAFPGIDDNGTWLIGLVCGNCRNPAPWYMSILKPCSM
jgi:hypothetical protein